MVIRGKMQVTVDDKEELEACAGQVLYLPKDHVYEYRFPEVTEYVPICLPAYHPSIANRVEA
jgi:ethanolamine utilization protein EutQ (cupin superfamily)